MVLGGLPDMEGVNEPGGWTRNKTTYNHLLRGGVAQWVHV